MCGRLIIEHIFVPVSILYTCLILWYTGSVIRSCTCVPRCQYWHLSDKYTELILVRSTDTGKICSIINCPHMLCCSISDMLCVDLTADKWNKISFQSKPDHLWTAYTDSLLYFCDLDLDLITLIYKLLKMYQYLHAQMNVLDQDKRLFQCGSQEAGLVKYDKYTCKKWTVGLGYNKNTRYKIHNKQLAIWKIKCTIKYKLHTVLKLGQGVVKEGLIFCSSRVWYWIFWGVA